MWWAPSWPTASRQTGALPAPVLGAAGDAGSCCSVCCIPACSELPLTYRPVPIMRAVCASFFLVAFSFTCMTLSWNIWLNCLAHFLRNGGIVVVWCALAVHKCCCWFRDPACVSVRAQLEPLRRVYSTLLLQLAVPNAMLGRVLSLELAAFTAALSLTTMWSGLAMDDLDVSPSVLALWASAVGCVVGVLWTLHTWLVLPRTQLEGQYEAVGRDDAEAQTLK